MWTPSLRRVSVGYSSCQCDHGRGPADETEGSETTWIQRRIVEDRCVVLVGGPQRTAWGRGRHSPLE